MIASSRPSRAAGANALQKMMDMVEREKDIDDVKEDKDDNDIGDMDLAEDSGDESLSGHNSSAESGYESGDSFIAKKRAPKSQELLDAEHTVCEVLGINAKEFATIRASIRHIYNCISWDIDQFSFKYAYSKMQFTEVVPHNVRDQLIAIADVLSKQVDIPYHTIQQAFSPLHEFNGGFFTRASCHMRKVFGIAILADLVEQYIDLSKVGSTQQNEMNFLLQNMGLDSHAAISLSVEHSTDTVVDSTRAAGRSLVEQINSLDEDHRIQCCLMQIQNIRMSVACYFPSSNSKEVKCSYLYDQTRTRNAAKTALHDRNLHLSVSIMDKRGSSLDTTIQNLYGKEYAFDKARYKSYRFDTVGRNEEPYSIPLRASQIIDGEVNAKTIFNCIQNLLTNEAKAPKMQNVINTMYKDRNDASIPLNLPPNTLIGFAYNHGGLTKWLKLGKYKPRDRRARKELSEGNARDELFNWIRLEKTHYLDELAKLIPPWVAFEFGTMDVYIILPGSGSEGLNSLSLETIIHSKANLVADEAARLVELQFRRLPSGRLSKKKLTEDQKEHIVECADKAYDTFARQKLCLKFKKTSYPDWHDKGMYAFQVKRGKQGAQEKWDTALKKRKADVEMSIVNKKAREDHETKVNLCPGGSLYEESKKHFEENV